MNTSYLTAEAKVVITADEAPIEDGSFPLKERVDKALEDGTTSVRYVLVATHTVKNVPMTEKRDISLDKVRQYYKLVL